ncbi:hypothetical protein BH24PSE1_BH24PSE1_01120 [soil metagenome]
MTIRSNWLLAGGCLSLSAAVLHLACIAGGPRWYRFLGAGEGMARAAERGELRPALLTAGIAALLAAWAAYAFSGAGVIERLPLLRVGLVVISATYLLRGMVLFMPSLLSRPDLTASFLLWSSLVVLVIGLIHVIGTWRAWQFL